MVFPLPATAPVMLPTGESAIVHEKVVPLIVELNTILVMSVEQMICDVGVAVAIGVGFTVIVKVCVGPSQVTPPLVK